MIMAEDKQALLSDSEDTTAIEGEVSHRRHDKPRFALLIALGFLAALSLVLAVALAIKQPTDQQCARQISSFCLCTPDTSSTTHQPADRPFAAPLLDVVEYEERDFENDFDQKSIYRGPPTPSIEDAWDKLWRRRVTQRSLLRQKITPVLTFRDS